MSETAAVQNKNSVKLEESMHIHDAWYEEAGHMTLDKLPEFLERLQNRYEHDYGTICHAIAASAIATAWAMNHGPQGGITGFQAGAIMWEFIKHWGHLEGPARLQDFEKMLYPQYEEHFNSIDKDTFEYLQKKAAENLAEEKGSDSIREHWQSIVDGKVPFGYVISE